jgi:MoaA/NifB/PqqE/SkfB family radical SAM enzyme
MSKLASVNQYGYYAKWFILSKMGRKSPLVNTMLVNFECNLRCKHCSVHENMDKLSGPSSMSFEVAVREMEKKYQEGARIVFFEGGEPTLWKDGDKDLRDLIYEGKRIGYFVTGYTTNGTNVIFEESDVISVSLDGPKDVHDRIRGEGVFDSLMKNLGRTRHGNIFANMVVMQENKDALKETVEAVVASGRINGIMINFLTPPPKAQALSLEEKGKVVEQALLLKKEGYPILNTDRGLKELLIEDYEKRCPAWASAFVLPGPTYFYGCPMRGTEACKQCGFDAVREYSLIVRGNPLAISQMSGRFALSKKGGKK